jgi:hypothetical protein
MQKLLANDAHHQLASNGKKLFMMKFDKIEPKI